MLGKSEIFFGGLFHYRCCEEVLIAKTMEDFKNEVIEKAYDNRTTTCVMKRKRRRGGKGKFPDKDRDVVIPGFIDSKMQAE